MSKRVLIDFEIELITSLSIPKPFAPAKASPLNFSRTLLYCVLVINPSNRTSLEKREHSWCSLFDSKY
jgi:hypothetical protein